MGRVLICPGKGGCGCGWLHRIGSGIRPSVLRACVCVCVSLHPRGSLCEGPMAPLHATLPPALRYHLPASRLLFLRFQSPYRQFHCSFLSAAKSPPYTFFAIIPRTWP